MEQINNPINNENKEEIKKESVGEATFEKGTNNKKKLILSVVLIAVVLLAVFFGIQGNKKNANYTNPVHGYSFDFKSDENTQLVAAGNIPEKLKEKGVQSMQDFNLNDGDALLIKTDAASKDNIVYTVLELSKREGYSTFDEYLQALRLNLTNTTQSAGTKYVEIPSTVGKGKSPATEFSFEMNVLTNQETKETRVGVFYDTLFEMGGRAFSISFGYPKDIADAEKYVKEYHDLVNSFSFNEKDITAKGVVLPVAPVPDVTENKATTTEIKVEATSTGVEVVQ